jgi:hypothetical protein
MVDTFAQRVAETSLQGRSALWLLCLDEWVALPGALLRAYTTPISLMKEDQDQPAPLAQPWRELLLALVVFLLPAGTLLSIGSGLSFPDAPGGMETLLFLFIMLSLGWIGGLPLWSRPYISLVLAVGVYLYLFQHIARQISPALMESFASGPWDRSTNLILQVASNGMLWLMLFCLTLLAVALLAALNRFQPLFESLRHDWSLLSYILYGESIFALLLLQSRQGEPGYLFASLLCLSAGVWYFLRASRPAAASPAQRLLALLVCLSLAVSVVAVQNKASPVGSRANLLQLWGWMAIALPLPGLLARVFLRLPTRSRPGASG